MISNGALLTSLTCLSVGDILNIFFLIRYFNAIRFAIEWNVLRLLWNFFYNIILVLLLQLFEHLPSPLLLGVWRLEVSIFLRKSSSLYGLFRIILLIILFVNQYILRRVNWLKLNHLHIRQDYVVFRFFNHLILSAIGSLYIMGSWWLLVSQIIVWWMLFLLIILIILLLLLLLLFKSRFLN